MSARSATLAVLLVLIGLLSSTSPVQAAARPRRMIPSGGAKTQSLRCNGYEALCDRRVDAVTFAATHNSMNAADLGWLWPNQEESIPTQLDRGIRGFLIDTHYWENTAERDSYLHQLSPTQAAEFTATAEPAPIRLATYLCHGMCESGNTDLVLGLRLFTNFIAAHRNEVIILDVEDHISPADTQDAFRQSGLMDYVYTHTAGVAWPTLRALIRENHRVIVEAENSGTSSAWYGRMYDEAWDTPYTSQDATGFTCNVTRGTPDHALLLMNHWIAQRIPNRGDAVNVNRYDTLMAHAQRCMTERTKTPNLIAVDFASIGDLQGVVAALNGVIGPPIES